MIAWFSKHILKMRDIAKERGVFGVLRWLLSAIWVILWFHTRKLVMALPDVEASNNTRQKQHFLALQPDDRLLDIGSREGHDSSRLTAPRCHVCLDIDIQAIRQGQQRHSALQFLVADARYLPFRDRAFSKVLASEILEHVEEYEMIFQEIDRATTLDACVVTSTPHAPTLQTYPFPILALCQSRWIRWMFRANTRFLKWLCQGSFVNRGGYETWKDACGHVRDGLSLQQYETLARHSDLQIDTIIYGYKSFSARILWEIQWLIWPNSWKFLLWIPHTCVHLVESVRHTRAGFNILIKWRKIPPDASS